jgi:sugar lactone lactonase YvrE
MAVDEDGNLWIAMFGGGCVQCFTPAGKKLEQIDLPVTQVTSVAFGGEALSDLYITSARYELQPDDLSDQPYAGATFVCSPGVRGLPVGSFAG